MSRNITGNPNSLIYGNGSIGSFGTSDYFNPSNLTVLYSMRSAVYYNGPVVNVRRSTDSVSSDFYTNLTQSYFTTGANGTGTTYDSWITGATGYVRIWYDQSGKGNNATNSVNGATQPLIAKITAPNSSLYYTINWIAANDTYLTMTTAMNPNTIFCHFWNDSTSLPTIISGVYGADDNFRFISGTNFTTGDANDWYFSGTGTKIAYVNGVSTTTVTLSGWNVMGTSVSSPVTFNFQLVGRGGLFITPSRNINGYMVDFFAHNTTIDSNNMIQYYNDRLF
jgi:hypothetical protein